MLIWIVRVTCYAFGQCALSSLNIFAFECYDLVIAMILNKRRSFFLLLSMHYSRVNARNVFFYSFFSNSSDFTKSDGIRHKFSTASSILEWIIPRFLSMWSTWPVFNESFLYFFLLIYLTFNAFDRKLIQNEQFQNNDDTNIHCFEMSIGGACVRLDWFGDFSGSDHFLISSFHYPFQQQNWKEQ